MDEARLWSLSNDKVSDGAALTLPAKKVPAAIKDMQKNLIKD